MRDEFGNHAELRCLDGWLTADPGFQRAYPAEVAALAGLAEPRVAAAQRYVASAAGPIVAVIRRRLTGAALSEVLSRLPRGLDAQTAALVVRDVLAALDALHSRGVAHRFMHPDRIIVEPDGTCVLIDAGLVPRLPDDDPAAALAEDLAAIPDLYAACASARQPAPGPGVRTLREWAAVAELEGMRGVLHAALVAARSTDRTGDQSGQEAASNGPAAMTGPPTAAQLLAALGAATADSFDTGWEELGRHRLAAAVKAQRPPRLRVVELRSPRTALLHRSARGSHAGARRDNRDLPAATAAVFRQAWTQLVGLWMDGSARRQDPERASRAGYAGRASHALRPRPTPVIGRYVAPLIAFLLTFGLVILVLSAAHSTATTVLGPPTRTGAAVAVQTGQSNVSPVGPATTAATGAGADASPTNVTHPPAAPTTAMAAPPRVTSTLTSAPKTVVSLTITGFGYDGRGNQVQAVIAVKTSGPAAVALAVTFASPDGLDTVPGGPKTHRYTLSGQTGYTITATVHIPHYCSYFGPQAVAVVRATASVPPSQAAAAAASRQLWAAYC